MTSRKLIALVAALLVLLIARPVNAEPITFEPGAPLNLRISTGSTLTTDGGSTLRLPPGAHIIGEPEYSLIDEEVRRLQDVETRLQAENDSLKKSARAAGVGWGVVGAFVLGVVGGIAIHRYAL